MRSMYSQPRHSYVPLRAPMSIIDMSARVKLVSSPKTVTGSFRTVEEVVNAVVQIPLTPPPSPVHTSVSRVSNVEVKCPRASRSTDGSKKQNIPTAISIVASRRSSCGPVPLEFIEVANSSGFKRSSYTKGKRLFALHIPPVRKAASLSSTPPSSPTISPNRVRPDTFRRSPVTAQRPSETRPIHWCRSSVLFTAYPH